MNTRFKNGVLHFDYKAEELASKEQAARIIFEKELAEVLSIPKDQRTFENTVLKYTRAFDNYSDPFGTAFFLGEVSPDKKLRDAAAELEGHVGQYLVEVGTRKDLYNAIKEYADTKPTLGVPEAKLLEDLMKGFKKSGLNLPDDKLEQYRKLQQEKTTISIKYSQNLREYKDPLAVTKEELKGLEDSFINRLQKTEDGKYLVTLDYPDYGPVMLNADNEDVRRRLEYKYIRRGGEENVKLFEDILALRRRTAKVLGEKNFAVGVLEYRMAKTPENVEKFLKDLAKQLQPISRKDDKKVLAFKKEKTGIAQKVFNGWDSSYWFNKYKKTYYDIDPEKVKEYFPSEYVVENMLSIFGEIFGVKFERTDIPVWHKDVRAFKVINTEDNKLIAYVYMDLYPRDGKYKHAACWPLEATHLKTDGTYQKPFTAIVANFNPPSAGMPSLLKHDEVETLFHEFGHVLHNVLSTAKYPELAGTNVSRDFVEAPSQIMENWAWNKDVLKRISKHYQTGASLPDDMIEKMLAAKKFASAGGYLRQDVLASYDMYIHTRTKYVDSVKTYIKMSEKIRKMPVTPGNIMPANFEHLVGGYQAGYYGYLWSEVIAQDFWSVFEKEGIMNPATGKRFRDTVLAVGGTYEEEDTVKKVLGREVSNKAFLESLGID